MTDVSPKQGHASLAAPSVTTAPVLSTHSSKAFPLTSQFRGPFVMNMADGAGDDDKDPEKQSNFDKVRQKAEREEEARIAAEAERDALRKEKADREAADKQATEDRLKKNQEFEQLAKDKEAEAQAKADEATREKARADAAEAKVAAFEQAQEAELTALLDTIPADKRPPLDAADPVVKRLSQVKYAKQLLGTGPKEQVGAGARQGEQGDKQARFDELRRKPRRTAEEGAEMLKLEEELTGS